jgi:cysteinyl-tRNA synthetase
MKTLGTTTKRLFLCRKHQHRLHEGGSMSVLVVWDWPLWLSLSLQQWHHPNSNQRQRYFSTTGTTQNSNDSTRNSTTTTTTTTTTTGMKLYNTLTGRIEPIETYTGKTLAWYTCGPTVYAPAHLGHARTYVCLDIIRRVLMAHHDQQYPSSLLTSSSSSSATTTTTTIPSSLSSPLFVLNITDIDDKILHAAAEHRDKNNINININNTSMATNTTTTTTNNYHHHPMEITTPIQLARRFEREFWRDWDALNCLRPHVVTRVTDYVESHIIPYIQRLVDQEFAYLIIDNDIDNNVDNNANDNDKQSWSVYFDVRAFNERMGHRTKYGKLAPPAAAKDILNIFSRTTTKQQQKDTTTTATTLSSFSSNNHHHTKKMKKKDPRDFVLWKKQKSNETVFWSSPWGMGRPGWHIECSAMIQAIQEQFQDTHQFLVHAGGIDLTFPHHTNEIAQSEAYNNYYNFQQQQHVNNMTSLDNNHHHNNNNNEWIPHWVHTGHLHIDGLKMSKSLKNFVTIQEFLYPPKPNHNIQQHAPEEREASTLSSSSLWHCPADDFRLWCLGLSGSYRGPATFSETRLAEAQSIRHKIVTFLIEGETWIEQGNHNNNNNHHHHNNESSSLSSSSSSSLEQCSQDQHDLLLTIQQGKIKALTALKNDFDGSTFLSELMVMVESSSAYMQNNYHPQKKRPVEVVLSALHNVRDLLRLVGFTRKTVDAGRVDATGAAANVSSLESSTLSALETSSLLKILVNFRSAVRHMALLPRVPPKHDVGITVDERKELLRLSDEIRDKTLPEMGIQLVDGRDATHDTWKLCPPRKNAFQQDASDTNKKQQQQQQQQRMTDAMDLQSIPLQEYFKVGPYTGLFSDFTDEGMPIHYADGTEVSKRLLKKLWKKRQAHEKRLQSNQQ